MLYLCQFVSNIDAIADNLLLGFVDVHVCAACCRFRNIYGKYKQTTYKHIYAHANFVTSIVVRRYVVYYFFTHSDSIQKQLCAVMCL